MKVLHINQFDIFGGAAIAGYRLHQGLLAQGIDSRLLVGCAKTSSELVAVIPQKSILDGRLFRITNRLGLNDINFTNSFDIPKHPFYKEANIINFHNLHSNYFNYLSLPLLTRDKPAFFTLHDMWSFTGHCAYSYDCDRWRTGCGSCPYLEIEPYIRVDNTRLEWKLKQWIYQKSTIKFVAPSHWLMHQAKQSMLQNFPIHHIPYGIDTEAYQPLDSEQCRFVLGIPSDKKVLMFGAQSLNNPRKGGDLLLKALQLLPESLKSEIILLTLGEDGDRIIKDSGIAAINLGYASSDRIKSIAFSAADIFLLPTRADNLPLVLQESMACSTPMVSFKVGGISDLVRPEVTGYLAEPENAKDFCDGIIRLLEDRALRVQMQENCRKIALQEYTLELQAKRYVDIYNASSVTSVEPRAISF